MLKKTTGSTNAIKNQLKSDDHPLVLQARKKLGIPLTQESNPSQKYSPRTQDSVYLNPNCQDIPKEVLTEMTRVQEAEELDQEMENFQMSYAIFLSKPAVKSVPRKFDEFVNLEDSEEENEEYCSDYDSDSDSDLKEKNPSPKIVK